MREIPVSSLGGDKVRVEANEWGDYAVTVFKTDAFPDHTHVAAHCPTEALLAIVADRLREADCNLSNMECVESAFGTLYEAARICSNAPTEPDDEREHCGCIKGQPHGEKCPTIIGDVIRRELDLARRKLAPTQPDADQIGEGR